MGDWVVGAMVVGTGVMGVRMVVYRWLVRVCGPKSVEHTCVHAERTARKSLKEVGEDSSTDQKQRAFRV